MPFIGGAFTGFLAGLLHEGKLYRFTTYTGARLRSLEVDENEVSIVIEGKQRRLEIHARREAGGCGSSV